jgi:hypothetical protein
MSDQAPRLDAHAHGIPVQPVYPSKKLHIRRSPTLPPPYTAPPSPEEALFPPHLSSRNPTPTPPRLPKDHETSRRLPAPRNPRIAIPVERTTSLSELSSSSSQQSPIQQLSRDSPFTSPLIPSSLPQSDVKPSSFLPLPPDAPVAKSRSVFNPLSVLKLSKSSRKAAAQSAKQAAGKVSEETKMRLATLQHRPKRGIVSNPPSTLYSSVALPQMRNASPSSRSALEFARTVAWTSLPSYRNHSLRDKSRCIGLSSIGPPHRQKSTMML